MIIIITMPRYKGGKFNYNGGLLWKWQVNDVRSDNNKDKICLLLKR